MLNLCKKRPKTKPLPFTGTSPRVCGYAWILYRLSIYTRWRSYVVLDEEADLFSASSLHTLAQMPQFIRSELNYVDGRGGYFLCSEQVRAAICVTEKNESVTHWSCKQHVILSGRCCTGTQTKKKACVLTALQCHRLPKLRGLRKSLERAAIKSDADYSDSFLKCVVLSWRSIHTGCRVQVFLSSKDYIICQQEACGVGFVS